MDLSKKIGILGVSLIFGILLVGGVFAIDLDVFAKPVLNSVISDLDEPAVFDLVIENNGEGSDFEIYSLVGVDFSPEHKFSIGSGEVRTVRVSVMPQEALQSKTGFFTFEYRIKNLESEVQKEALTVNMVDLESAFDIVPGNINPNSEMVGISIKNKVSNDFEGISLKISSAFFEYDGSLDLKGLQIKEIEIPIDSEKVKSLDAGSFLVNSIVKIDGVSASKEAMIKFLEQEDIDFSEEFSGWIKKRQEVVRHNVGNVRKSVVVNVERNLISSLFTSFNVKPSESSFSGFGRSYIWEKEIVPNEEFKVVVVTNWFYPVFIILLIVGLVVLIKKYLKRDIILRKKVSFIRTKGGQFALKVMLRVKADKHVERISIVDKLPHLVSLYDKFGAVAPDDIDLKNRRLEWEIESLNKGEERVFSYIIYSKVGVVGRFELPSCRAVYEREGRVREVSSNRAFFINDQG